MRKQQILNFERLMNENLGDMAHSVELDHEVQLARSELYKLAKYAIKLHNMLKDADPEQGLESWVQADITKSAESISKVFHSLEYEMKVSSNTQDLGSTTSPAANSDSSLPFESTVRNRSRNKYKESLSRKLKKKTITEAPASNHEWEGNHGAAQGPAAKPKATRQVARKPAADSGQQRFAQQMQQRGSQAPAAKPAAKPAANPAAQQANFAQGGGGAAPAANPAAKPAANPAAQQANFAQSGGGATTQQGANQKISSPEPEVDKGFQPTHFHKGNVGNKIPLQYKNGKWFWQEDGVVKPWEGDVNDRGWLGSASVDGEIVNGTEVPYGDDETFADRQAAKPAAPAEPGKVDPGLQQALNKGGQQPAPQQNVAQAPAAELPAVNKGGQQPAPQTVSAQTGQQPSNAGSTEAKKNSDGTYTQPGKPAQRFGRSNYNSRKQLPLTPNVEFTGRMRLKFKGKAYGFAGPDKMPPETGIDISIPNKYQMIGSGNFRGKGLPVRLSGGSYYRLT